MLLLCALVAGSGSVWAEETTIESNFTDKDCTVGTGELGWTASNVSQFEKSGSARGVQSTKNTTNFVFTSNKTQTEALGTIKKIVITASANANQTIDVTVGGSTFGSSTSLPNKSANVDFTFTGSASGQIVITISRSSSSTAWVKKIVVTYEPASSDPVDLTSFAFSTATPSVQLAKNGTSYDATYTQAVGFEPAAYDGAITYSIDYDDANTTLTDEEAIIDDETGEVSISLASNKSGSVVVKASGAATSDYNAPADASYTLTVNAADLTLGNPVFTPAAGAYYYGQLITASALNSEFITYTTDGSDPDDSSDSFPVAGYTLTGNVTLKAIAFDEDINSSAITTAAYTLKAPEAPTFSLASGEVKAGTTVTLTAGEGGSVVVYTTDGSTPTADSDIYDGPIAINAAMTIKAATVDDGDNLSAVTSVSFTIKQTEDFVKVTDASTLRAGDQFILVYETGNIAMGAINSGGKYYEKVDVTISGSTVSDPTGAAILTLGGSVDSWTLQSSLSDNYLSLTSNSNELKESSYVSDNNTESWKISITDGNVKIINVANPSNNSNDRYIQWNDGSSGKRFACYGGTQKDLQLYRLSKSVTITSAEYATYCGTLALDFSTTGITAYTATDGETKVTLNEIESGKVPANTPVVLYKAGADGTAINVPVTASADAVEGTNDLHVSTGTDVDYMYVLSKQNSKVGFYPWNGSSDLSAGKIYLQGKASYGARSFIGFDDVTAVGSMEALPAIEGAYYNLNGQQVAQPAKGLYIVNGKKVVIK